MFYFYSGQNLVEGLPPCPTGFPTALFSNESQHHWKIEYTTKKKTQEGKKPRKTLLFHYDYILYSWAMLGFQQSTSHYMHYLDRNVKVIVIE